MPLTLLERQQATVQRYASTARTQSWYLGHEVGEVEVIPSLPLYGQARIWEPTRGWLWQVWPATYSHEKQQEVPGRIGVMLYSQRLEIIGKQKKRVKLIVTFHRPEDVDPVRQARGWPAPPQEVLWELQRTEAEEEAEARAIMAELWEVKTSLEDMP